MTTITKHPFGKTRDGQAVSLYRMKNRSGAFVELCSYGCTLRAVVVPDRNGKLTDVCLGYDTILEYEQNDGYLGAVVGRVANRIKGGRFTLNGRTYPLCQNDGENTLHGGRTGFDRYLWDASVAGDRVIFSRRSPDMEEGFPGNLNVSVAYSFSEDQVLEIKYEAFGDEDTPVNLMNHAYWNLAGSGSILNHLLTIPAYRYTESDEQCVPTGRILPVAGTPFDFTAAKSIGRDINQPVGQLDRFGGYDHNFVLNPGDGLRPAAFLASPESGIAMQVSTTLPGMQLYTANGLGRRRGLHGQFYGPHEGVCLETQFFPAATDYKNFPSIILPAGKQYAHSTAFHFWCE